MTYKFVSQVIIMLALILSSNINAQNLDYNRLTDEGLKLLESQDIVGAQDKFNTALKIDSSRVEAYYGLGVSYLFYCSKQEIMCNYSLYYLNKAIEIDSTYRNEYYNRGHCKAFLNDYQGAMSDFNKAIAKDSTDANSLFSRAMIYLKLNNKNAACEDLYKSLKLGSENALRVYTISCDN